MAGKQDLICLCTSTGSTNRNMMSDDQKELNDQRSNVVCEMKKFKAVYEKCHEKGLIDSSLDLPSQLRDELHRAVVSVVQGPDGVPDRSISRRMSIDDLKQLQYLRADVICEMKKYSAIYEKCYNKGHLETGLELGSLVRDVLQKAIDEVLCDSDTSFLRPKRVVERERDSGCVHSDYIQDPPARESFGRTSENVESSTDIKFDLKIHGSKSTVSLTTHAISSPADPGSTNTQTQLTSASLQLPTTIAVQETIQPKTYRDDHEQTFPKQTAGSDC